MAIGNTEVRYRDWDTLKYWFRGVEKYAPWVRYIFFVSDDQKPEWLNLDHPKLKWIKHTDFIPAEYLPTFNSNVISWNLHRIEGLAEKYVYFNDDVFLINTTEPEDFFKKEMPCCTPALSIVYPYGFYSYTLFNNTMLLNRHFSLRESVRENWDKWIKCQSLKELLKMLFFARKHLIPGISSNHIHVPRLKITSEILWQKEYEVIHATCKNRLRTRDDVSALCVQGWQILSGMFYPQKPIGKMFSTANLSTDNAVLKYMRKPRGKVICLNDNENEMKFELHKQMIIQEFERIFPEKSSIE